MSEQIKFHTVQAVVFDLGGVFLEGGPNLVKAFGPQHGLNQAAWDAISHELFISGDLWGQVERAEMSLDAFAKVLIARMAAHGIRISMDEARYFMRDPSHESGMPLRPEVVDVAARLHRCMPTALLTNNIAEWREGWRARLDLDDLFDVVIDSSEVGMRKPEPGIYALTEEKLGLAGEQLLFVDDIGLNLKAGRARGWQTLKFEDSGRVVDVLGQLATSRPPRR
ncbi:MAG: HAD family phosphatase [Candidatus Lambdaproteobacteria bacterium]|nr:HAD family phosphatase [Candidatus Lambdaproteobacteria bacterium]